MYLQLIKDFFGNSIVKSFLLFCLFCYLVFLFLSYFSDINYHKKKRKELENSQKLLNQKQMVVSESEV